MTYGLIMFLIILCGIYILAMTALKWLKIAQILKQICRHLIVIVFNLQKKPYTDDEIEKELEELMSSFGA